jgi:hypothetical protein
MNENKECYLEDDETQSSEVIAVEAEDRGERQALWVRVGPYWDADGNAQGPVVWVMYQEKYLGGLLSGPVMLIPEVWRELVDAVNGRLEDFGLDAYKPVQEYLREDVAPDQREA